MMPEILRRLRYYFRRREFEAELDEEMRQHAALSGSRQFGNVTALKEESRAMWGWRFLEQLGQDLRYALRSIRNQPLFAALAVLSLALGIGANTALYSFTEAILLRPLPVPDPESLVVMKWRANGQYASSATKGFSESTNGGYIDTSGERIGSVFPFPALEAFARNQDALDAAFGYYVVERFNLSTGEQAESVPGQYVSGEYFRGMRIAPSAGRFITPDDDRAGAPPIAVLSHGLSLRHFGEPAAAVGRTVRVNGTPFTVAGVTPPGFFGADPEGTPALYLPLQTGVLLGQIPYRSEGFYWIEIMGRLKPGVSLERAQATLAPRFRQLIEASAETEAERTSLPQLMLFDGSGGLDSIRHQYSTPLMMLIAMAALILLIACANIANLLLARSAARGREIAVRLSMGAARGRVVRQLLTESVALACMGALPGVAFAWWSIRFLTALLATGQDGFTMRAELNSTALAVALGLAVVTGILFGLAPALRATRADTMPALREVRTGATRAAGRRAGLSGSLVAVQIALALLLMVGAGVFGRTLGNLHGVELGFNPRNVLLFSINTAGAGYQGRAAYDVFEELRQRFARAPGVRAASLSFRPLPAGSGTLAPTTVAGAKELPPRDSLAGTFTAGPSFFHTMEIPLLLGREFDERDTGARLVAIVNERLLRLHGIEDPLGRTIRMGLDGGRTYEIVGVARDALFLSLKRDIDPMVYFPLAQAVRPPLEMTFELRTTGDPLDFAPSARQIVRETDPRLSVADLRSQEAHVDRAISREILLARLCTFFAALALAIACVGLYGTVAYAVARRTSEIGIRMALGAQRGRVLWMVLRQVMLTVTAGLILGLPLAYTAASLADAFVFRMEAQDPATLAAAVAVLIAAAGLASYIPARRASRIDPVVALRNE